MTIDRLVDIAQIAAAILAAVGLCITAYQVSQSTKQRRISRVDDVRKELYGNDELKNIYYVFEYSEFKYSTAFHKSPEERSVDRLLSLFDSVAKQVEMNMLKISDLELVAYEYLVIYDNSELKEYFNFLDEWFKENNIPREAFISFRRIGERLRP